MTTRFEDKKRELTVLFYTIIVFTVTLIPIVFFCSLPFVLSYSLGYLVCLVNILFSVASMRWGFAKKSTTFYKVVWGGMLLRLALFSAILIILIKFTQWPVSGFLISFVIFYLYLQYHEVRLVNENLSQKNDTRNS
jgi:hypothetical protein